MNSAPSRHREGSEMLASGSGAIRARSLALLIAASLVTATTVAEASKRRSATSRYQAQRSYAAALYVSLAVAHPLVTRTMTPLIRRPTRPERIAQSESRVELRPSFRESVMKLPVIAWVKEGVPLDGTIPVDGLTVVPWLRTPGVKLEGHF